MVLAVFILCLAGCAAAQDKGTSVASISSYRDIPGVTEEEINAFEALKAARASFTYGQLYETEAFILPDGAYAGFAARFCSFLTELFGVEFNLQLCEWNDILDGLGNGQIDFAGDLTPTPERMRVYYMTYPIAERSMRIFQSEDSDSVLTESGLTGQIVGSLVGSIDIERVNEYYPDLEYIVKEVASFEEAAQMLLSGEIDAFITEGVVDPLFDGYGVIKSKELFSLVYIPVSMTTADPELKIVIEMVNKYIAAGGIDQLFELYSQGNEDYARFKLQKTFSDEENAYMSDLAANDATVKIVLEHDNYPISFYNNTEKKFQGIAVDVLHEISDLTGIEFVRVNDETTTWPHILEMLKTGEASLVSELLQTEERKGNFLWNDIPYTVSHYSLISKSEYPSLSTYQVVRAKVGAVSGSAYEHKYREWFPENDNLITFNTQIDALNALESGEIDLLMGCDYILLLQQNYREKPNYKININFGVPADSFFGLNIDERELCSIIGKAQEYVNTEAINTTWTTRGFDYNKQFARQQAEILMIIAVALALVLLLTINFLLRTRRLSRVLDKTVKERTLELENQTRVAQEANNAKSDFLAKMSHEMRTPLNAVIGLSELGLDTGRLADEEKDNLEKIYNAGVILLGTVNDILDISKIEAGKLELAEADYDLPGLINDTVTQNILRIGEKPIEFILDIEEDMFESLRGDELRVKQIMNNLLSNAIKFTAEGKVGLSVRCLRENDAVWLTIHVSDTGRGIDQQDIGKLFHDYSRLDIEANHMIEGTGLGLPIAKKLAEMMSGSVSVESELGKGSVFMVRIAQKFISDNRLGQEVAESLKRFRYSNRKRSRAARLNRLKLPYARVLVVDDNMTNLDVAKGLMKPYGMRIDCVTSGQQAVDAIRMDKVRYNAVFMDHMMPGLDGIEAAEKIREIDTEYALNIPIIALTANAIAGKEEMFINRGFQAFLSKPIDIVRLDDVIMSWVRDEEQEKLLGQQFDGLQGEQDKRVVTDRRSGIDRRKMGIKLAGLDIAKGIERFGGDERSYFSVLRSYAVNTRPLLEAMASVDEDSLAAYAITIHGIKGASRGIYADMIGSFAEKLEAAAKAGDIVFTEKHNKTFLDAAWKLILDIEEMLSGIDEESPKPKRDKPDGDALRRLAAACKAYNMDAMDEIMEEIDSFQYQDDDGLVEWIRENVKRMNLNEIVEKLSDSGE